MLFTLHPPPSDTSGYEIINIIAAITPARCLCLVRRFITSGPSPIARTSSALPGLEADGLRFLESSPLGSHAYAHPVLLPIQGHLSARILEP
jgi:hypothetical protein